MRLWVVQVLVAFVACLVLGVVLAVTDIDTNLDTGNTIAIGLVELAVLWLVVAIFGATISYVMRLLGRRR
jgi:hypothetical protein